MARQVESGDRRIIGMMMESNLFGGRPDLVTGQPLIHGRSVTDGCIDWDTSVAALERLARAVEQRRGKTRAVESESLGTA